MRVRRPHPFNTSMDTPALRTPPTTRSTGYLELTRSPLYSVLISLPLFLLYEIGALLFLQSGNGRIGIGPEHWMKWLLHQVGIDSTLVLSGLVLLAGGVVYWRERKQGTPVLPKYLGFMVAESAGYAVTSGYLVSGVVGTLLLIPVLVPLQTGPQLGFTQNIVLSLGAGLYEELFFRLILVSALAWGLTALLRKKKAEQKPNTRAHYIVAAVVGALFFSTVHYIGSMADHFTLGSFLFRFMMGLVLNALFVFRGFGVAALTHALFDVWVTILKS